MYLSAGYHDPVYDETGTPGGAAVPIPVYPAPVQEPTFNPVIWGVAILLLLMMSDGSN